MEENVSRTAIPKNKRNGQKTPGSNKQPDLYGYSLDQATGLTVEVVPIDGSVYKGNKPILGTIMSVTPTEVHVLVKGKGPVGPISLFFPRTGGSFAFIRIKWDREVEPDTTDTPVTTNGQPVQTTEDEEEDEGVDEEDTIDEE